MTSRPWFTFEMLSITFHLFDLHLLQLNFGSGDLHEFLLDELSLMNRVFKRADSTLIFEPVFNNMISK